jgi:hypothetical protein
MTDESQEKGNDMAATETTSLQQYVAYFEEPEPGVPIGCSGWYHSNGLFTVQGASDVFQTTTTGGSHLVKPKIAGPFCSREQAISDLQSTLNG